MADILETLYDNILLKTDLGVRQIYTDDKSTVLLPSVVLKELQTDRLVKTSQPVEFGANISDHAYTQPATLQITAKFANSSISQPLDFLNSSENSVANAPSKTWNDTPQQIYERLKSLQSQRLLVNIVTGKKLYKNMMLTELVTDTDRTSENALSIQASFEEVIFTSTQFKQSQSVAPADDLRYITNKKQAKYHQCGVVNS